jgi:hypothetical protein
LTIRSITKAGFGEKWNLGGMNLLAHWARHHRRTAIGLIILLETVKITAGLHIGRYGLPALPPDVLQYLVLAVAAALLTVWRRHYRTAGAGTLPRRRVRRDLLLLFQGGYLLSVLAGNLGQSYFGDSGGYPLWRAQAVEMRRDTIAPTRPYEGHYPGREALEIPRRKNWGWRVAAYAALTILGFAVSLFAMYLACALACSGQGALAILALIGLIGGYALLGGLAFKAIINSPKAPPLTKAGRRREVFGLLLGVAIGSLIFVLMTLGV